MISTKVFIGIAIALCLCACASTPNSRFYVLNANQETTASDQAAIDRNLVSICVGPVIVAAYLDRLQLCIRDSGNEVTYAEFDRWAEPLESGIARVLVENLSHALNTARIDVFPWKSPAPVDYQVRIMVLRFDGERGGQAKLKARWLLEAAGHEKPVFDIMVSIVEPVDSKKYEDLVRAQNKALEKLSHEIAGVIKQVAGKNN